MSLQAESSQAKAVFAVAVTTTAKAVAPGSLRSALQAVFGRPAATGQVACGIHQPDVGKCLRKVAHQAPCTDVVLFGQQPDVIAQIQEPLENTLRVGVAPQQSEVIGKPESTGQERSLSRR